MNDHKLPDGAVFAIEDWARRNDIVGETVAEREAVVARIYDALHEASTE